MPSVLIVEDHALFRSGLKQLIGIEPGLTVAGEAGDGLAGIRLAQSLRPDLILLDISMPELSGVEAIPRIREVAPGARILIVSMHATAGHVRAALKAGACSKRRTRTSSSSPSGPCSREGSTSALSSPGP